MKTLKKKFHAIVTAFLVLYFIAPPFLAHSALGAANALMSFGMAPELARYVTEHLVNVNSDGKLILPAASGESIEFHVAGAEEATLSSTGALSTDSGITAATGNITSTAGSFVASTSGGTLHLQEATAGTKCMGTVTANGTTAVGVSTTCALTASRIFVSRTSLVAAGVTEPGCWATNIVNATSFDLDCNDAGEDSTFNWVIINEAA